MEIALSPDRKIEVRRLKFDDYVEVLVRLRDSGKLHNAATRLFADDTVELTPTLAIEALIEIPNLLKCFVSVAADLTIDEFGALDGAAAFSVVDAALAENVDAFGRLKNCLSRVLGSGMLTTLTSNPATGVLTRSAGREA